MSAGAVIIGASHAGSQLALSLRQEGWTDPIHVITEEAYLPYHRPPLSKDYLVGNHRVDDILLRPAALYEKNQIEFLFNTVVTGIDCHQQTLSVNAGGKHALLPYKKLALCTGARVRELPVPGVRLNGVHYLRKLSDVEQIRADLPDSGKGIIIGGGYIGLEAAAMLRTLGQDITVLEAAPQLLGRVAAMELGEFYRTLHESHGVHVETGVEVTRLKGSERVTAVDLADGRNLPCDYVIIGIGVTPNQEIAAAAGLKTDDGIVVNEFAQTSDPKTVAAGDCTRFHHPVYGDIRLESVPNATEQAKAAAATLCGKEKPHHGLPWFWSDQYDCKLQIAGLSQGFDQVIVRGESNWVAGKRPSFCVYYFKQERLIAADCINRPREFMLAKMWLQKGHTPERTKLMDDDYTLGKED